MSFARPSRPAERFALPRSPPTTAFLFSPDSGAITRPSTSTALGDLPFQIAPPLPHVRQYADEDAEAVAAMWRASATGWPGGGPGGGEHSSAARVRQEQRDLSTLATFIAWRPDPQTGEELAVGYCSLFEYAREANTAYVGTLSARPDWHGTGIGRDLLVVSLQKTVELGYSRVDLNTWAGNLKAVPLYKKSGYFWVPDTQVKMENYLPAIFQLAPAQEFFRQVNWYRDFKRDLSLQPDDEKTGKLEVFTYLWERDGRRLRVVIDRRSKGLAALETDDFSLSASIDDPRLPIGGMRYLTWELRNKRSRPLSVSILAEGQDSVRCAYQASEMVEGGQTWTAPVTAEQPQGPAPFGRPLNRVRSTVVVEGSPLLLLTGTQVSQPLDVSFDGRRRWVSPGIRQRMWVRAENSLDEAIRGTLRLSATPDLWLDRQSLDFELGARRKLSWPVELLASQNGRHTLFGQATVTVLPAPHGTDADVPRELHTKIFEQPIFCGDVGEIYVEQDEAFVSLATDRLVLNVATRPRGDWAPGFSLEDRQSGRDIMRGSCSLGPPFVPSIFTTSTWASRVERDGASATLILSTSPDALPGLTFERVYRLSPSGVLRQTFRAINAGSVERKLRVSVDSNVDLSWIHTQVAAPLVSGLVIDDSMRFPDWQDAEAVRPERYAETWMAEFGDGWVGATIWPGGPHVKEVAAGWSAPSLTLDLGAIPPGGRAESPPVYVYAGQGDWKTARALWRQLVAPDAPVHDPEPRPAHLIRLERTVFDTPAAETRLLLDSERTRALNGTVTLLLDGHRVASGNVTSLNLDNAQAVRVSATLPAQARAVPAAVVFDHERSTERQEGAVFRVGDAGAPVQVRRDGALVRIDNGRLRLTMQPSPLAQVTELVIQSSSGQWQNQLYAAPGGQTTFVWFNPWFGGIHPMLEGGGSGGYPSKLREETFTWREAERTGSQGNHWRGVTLSTTTTATGQAGIAMEISYLTTGQSNLLAVVMEIQNDTGARLRGDLALATYLQPGGSREGLILHYLRHGERTQKRVHGGTSSTSDHWCAVESPAGPTMALLATNAESRVGVGDMGNEGVHPNVHTRLDLDPGDSLESVCYLVVADDVAQAKLYRELAKVGGLA